MAKEETNRKVPALKLIFWFALEAKPDEFNIIFVPVIVWLAMYMILQTAFLKSVGVTIGVN